MDKNYTLTLKGKQKIKHAGADNRTNTKKIQNPKIQALCTLAFIT